MKRKKNTKRADQELIDYDSFDTSDMIDPKKPLKLEELGIKLPDIPPTQVISIRLPSSLLNEIRSIGSQQDIPYQALVKLFLAQGVAELKKKKVA